jgi:predicted permease
MKPARKFRFWLGGLFLRRRFNSDMEDEMRMHLELRTEKNIAAGMSPREAIDAARREFGGIEQLKERARDDRGGVWLGRLVQDMRFGVRVMRKNPVFTAVAVLSLALGIGAATAVFSLVDSILLGSLPVPNPQDLRVICWSGSDTTMMYITLTGDPVVPGQRSGGSFSKEAFSAIRKQCAAEADIFAYVPFLNATARVNVAPLSVEGLMVSGNFFSGLGVRPLLGNLSGFEGGDPDAASRVAISYRYWEREFGSDPNVIGRPLTLNGSSFTVVGVLPRDFSGVNPGRSPDLYVSLSVKSLPFPGLPQDLPDLWWVSLMGRLKPGANESQLQAALDVALKATAGKFIKTPVGYIADGRDGPVWNRAGYRSQLRLLLAVVGVVLLVACVNISGLLLARGAARQHELSMRRALGAGRGRLVRQLLTESTLISLLGGGLGVLIALWGRMAVSRLLAGSSEGLHYDTTLDVKVLGFALAVTLATVLLTGIYPALKAARVDPLNGLKDRTFVGMPRLRAGQGLVAAQVAFSLVLVAGAGLFVRTLVNLESVDPGFSLDHILSFVLDPGDSGYEGPRLNAYYEQAQRSIAAIPGVRSAAMVSNPILGGMLQSELFTVPDNPSSGKDTAATVLTVSDSFFRTLGIPLLLGREFREGDREGAAKVVVVNELFARKFLSDGASVGRTVRFGSTGWQVVGVCRDSKCCDIKQVIEPTVYFPFRQNPIGRASFILRTSVAPLVVAQQAREVATAIDPGVSLTSINTAEQMRDQNITAERMFASYCGLLAAFVLVLSSIGLYGLMAYDVARRTGEFGIRVALGATPQHIVGPILKRALAIGFLGVAVGLPLTLSVTKVIRANLYGVTSSDPGTICAAAALLIAVVLLAAWAPALRATRVAPMVALRRE